MEKDQTTIDRILLEFELDGAVNDLLKHIKFTIPENMHGTYHPLEVIKMAKSSFALVLNSLFEAMHNENYLGTVVARLIVSSDLGKLTTTEQLLQMEPEDKPVPSIIVH